MEEVAYLETELCSPYMCILCVLFAPWKDADVVASPKRSCVLSVYSFLLCTAKVNGAANVNFTLEADRVSAKDAEEVERSPVPRTGFVLSL